MCVEGLDKPFIVSMLPLSNQYPAQISIHGIIFKNGTRLQANETDRKRIAPMPSNAGIFCNTNSGMVIINIRMVINNISAQSAIANQSPDTISIKSTPTSDVMRELKNPTTLPTVVPSINPVVNAYVAKKNPEQSAKKN